MTFLLRLFLVVCSELVVGCRCGNCIELFDMLFEVCYLFD